jgi:hypothetical protein
MTFTVVEDGYGKNYSTDELQCFLRAQIDNSFYHGWAKEDIVVATNFDFSYRDIKNTLITSICHHNKYFNKFYAIQELLHNKTLTDNFWFHDLDSWQTNPISFPDMDEDFGVCGYVGNDQWNTASMFLTPNVIDIVDFFVSHMETSFANISVTDNISDEHVVNPYAKQLIKMGCDRFKTLDNSYNVGWTFFEERLNNAIGEVKIIGVKPNSHREYNKFNEAGLIPQYLTEIFKQHGLV